MEQTTESIVRRVIAEQLGWEWNKDKVKPEAEIVGDLGADSLDQIELVMAIEEEFEIEISDNEAEECKTVQDIINVVERKLEIKQEDAVAPNPTLAEPVHVYSAPLLLGEVRDGVVIWFDQNPHAFPEGTKFYASERRVASGLKPSLYDDQPHFILLDAEGADKKELGPEA